MIRKKISRIPVKTYTGVSEFKLGTNGRYVSIMGYNIKSELAVRRSSCNICHIYFDGLNISIGTFNSRDLNIDTTSSNYNKNLIIDGVDEFWTLNAICDLMLLDII